MLDGAVEPLAAFPVFAGRAADPLREFLDGKGYDCALPRRANAPTESRINALYLPSLELTYLQYGTEALVRIEPVPADYRVHFLLHGSAELEAHGTRTLCRAGQGAITSPIGEHRVRSGADSRRVSVFLPADTVRRQLAALLGEPVVGAIRIKGELDLRRGTGRALADMVSLFVRQLDDPTLATNPLLVAQFEQSFLAMLLLGQPHEQTEVLRAPGSGAAPRDVKRALDYIEANLDAPITLEDLVRVSGVPGRTLRKHFRDFRGLAPLAYVRHARLQRAKGDLAQAGPAETVTSVARRWGFDHLGRFARDYHRLHGEPPSATLRRSPHR